VTQPGPDPRLGCLGSTVLHHRRTRENRAERAPLLFHGE